LFCAFPPMVFVVDWSMASLPIAQPPHRACVQYRAIRVGIATHPRRSAVREARLARPGACNTPTSGQHSLCSLFLPLGGRGVARSLCNRGDCNEEHSRYFDRAFSYRRDRGSCQRLRRQGLLSAAGTLEPLRPNIWSSRGGQRRREFTSLVRPCLGEDRGLL